MDNEQQTTPIVEAWLKGTSNTPYGTEMGVGRVRSRVRQTPQRGRWWRLPSFQRTPMSASAVPDRRRSHPAPFPTHKDRIPTVTGRTMTMLNATRFVVAGVIVALFGGVLLTGLLMRSDDDVAAPAATSPSPMADLFSTLVTEQVEPGIQRLTADGVGRSLRGLHAIDHAASGPVWANLDDGRVFRLGTAGKTPIDVQQQTSLVSSRPDGALVVLAGREAYLVTPTAADADGASAPASATSIAPALPSHVKTPTALAGAADGSVWASWTGDGGLLSGDDTRVLQYVDGEWQDHSGADGLGGLIDLDAGGYVCDITDTIDGAVFVGVCGYGATGAFGSGGLFRYLDGRWERIPVFAAMGRTDILVSEVWSLASGPDGTFWATTMTTTPRIAEAVAAGADWSVLEGLAEEEMSRPLGAWWLRLQDGRWSAYAWHDLQTDPQRLQFQWTRGGDEIVAVDADGVLWFGSPTTKNGRRTVTLGSFDGDEVRWYPEAGSARDVEIGPDGHPWVATADGIYVIDPTKVASEPDGPGPE